MASNCNRNIITIGMMFAAMTVNAHPSNKGKSVETKQEGLLEYSCCKITYDEIREQLREGAITIEEAQKLWLKHKHNGLMCK